MASCTAVFQNEPGGPLVLSYAKFGELRRTEIRVKTEAVAVNPGDQKSTDGRSFPFYPRIIGGDHSGVVVEIGAEVTAISKGDRVTTLTLNHGMPSGAFQDYIVTEAKFAIRIPDHYSFEEAVTVPSSALTILAAFHEFDWDLPYEINTVKTEPILVWGGGSSLGQAAISLLSLTGHRNIITTASSAHEIPLRKRGAKHVVDYRSSSVVETVRSLLKGRPLLKAIDTISSIQTAQQVLSLMSPGSDLGWVLPDNLPSRPDVNAKFVYCGKFQNGADSGALLVTTEKIFTILSKLLSRTDLPIQKQRTLRSTPQTRLDIIQEAFEIHRSKLTRGEKVVVTWS